MLADFLTGEGLEFACCALVSDHAVILKERQWVLLDPAGQREGIVKSVFTDSVIELLGQIGFAKTANDFSLGVLENAPEMHFAEEGRVVPVFLQPIAQCFLTLEDLAGASGDQVPLARRPRYTWLPVRIAYLVGAQSAAGEWA